jgi:hypothetical protein
VGLRITAATALVLASLPALAQEPRKISHDQANAVLAGLTELDGPRQEVAPDGRVLKRGTYDIDMRVVIVIAADTQKAKECVSLFQVGHNALQKKWADPKTGRVPDAMINEFVTAVNESGKDLCSLTDFQPIKWDDLKPAVNKFPPSVVSDLLPILIMPDEKK